MMVSIILIATIAGKLAFYATGFEGLRQCETFSGYVINYFAEQYRDPWVIGDIHLDCRTRILVDPRLDLDL